MDKISKNAAREFKDELCVCYSDNQNRALLTTKKDADKHKEDMDTYIRSSHGCGHDDLSDALGVYLVVPQVYFDFEEKYVSMMFCLGDVCASGAGISDDHIVVDGNAKTWFLKFLTSDNTVLMTDNDFESVQHASKVDLGLQDFVDVIKSLETRNKR